MSKQYRWIMNHIECPDEKGRQELLIELQDEGGKKIVKVLVAIILICKI